MPDFEAMYYKLFAQTENALVALEQQNYGTAKQILIAAQQEAEERYLAADPDDTQ